MTNAVNGYEDGVSAQSGSDSSAERDARGGPFVSRRRRLRNRWNVRMVKGERAQQLEQKQGSSTPHR
jgi:hypothetical protein